jgi:hypothetical protein
VRDRKISQARARSEYGVVIAVDELEIDRQATNNLRASRR